MYNNDDWLGMVQLRIIEAIVFVCQICFFAFYFFYWALHRFEFQISNINFFYFSVFV